MAKRPRGTRDFGPAQTHARHQVAQRLREVFARYGYHEVQTPTFEELELFTQKSGEGIVGELYDFEDKGGRRLALRPELTAPVMRFYFAEHAFDPKPVKWFYHANCFRYDRPQAGRYREFWQFGCEQIGAGTPMAYAELIALADACLRAVGLVEYQMGVGHVGVLRAAVDALGLEDDQRAAFMRAVDKRDRPEMERLAATASDPTALRRLESLMAAGDAATAVAPEAAEALAELDECMMHLDELGVQARLDLGIARGLDYYTGIVFEVHCDSLGAQSQVLGGGGYDLSGLFGAQSTPTMGFGMGFDRVLEAAEAQGADMPVPEGPEVAFGWIGDAARTQVLRWSRLLRQARVRVESDLIGRKPGKVAEWASNIGAKHLVIVGQRDLDSGSVQIKDLATGETRQVPLDDVPEAFSRH